MFKERFIEMYVILCELLVNDVLILVLDLLCNILVVNINKKKFLIVV